MPTARAWFVFLLNWLPYSVECNFVCPRYSCVFRLICSLIHLSNSLHILSPLSFHLFALCTVKTWMLLPWKPTNVGFNHKVCNTFIYRVWQEGGSAPIELSWSVGEGRKSGRYNIDVLDRLSAHTDWSAVFNWRKIVFHIPPPVTLYLTLGVNCIGESLYMCNKTMLHLSRAASWRGCMHPLLWKLPYLCGGCQIFCGGCIISCRGCPISCGGCVISVEDASSHVEATGT